MSLLRSFGHKHKNEVKSRFKTSPSARITALFFCALFMCSIAMPTYSSMALAAPAETKLPDALETVTGTQPAAADAQTTKGQKAGNAAMSGEALSGPTTKPSKPGSKHDEIVSKRTLNSKTYDIGGGQLEVRQYMSPIHFKDSSGKLEPVDTTLVPDTNAADSTNLFGEALSWVKGQTQDLSTYKVKANDWQARFASSSDTVGMVRIQADGKNITFSPKNTDQDVTPVISKTAEGIEQVRYPNLWKDVDVIYTVKSTVLKEEIILKSPEAEAHFDFALSGASLKKNKQGGFDIVDGTQNLSSLSVTLQKSGPTSDPVITQDFNDGVLSVTLDKTWLQAQAPNQFPVVIDPTWSGGPTVGYGYTAYKSDGTVCSSSVCFMNAGELYDNGWKNWRTVMCTGNINFLTGRVVAGAWMHLQQANRSYLAGYNGDRYFAFQHAASFSYGGLDGSAPGNWYLVNYASDLDVTNQVQFEANRGDWGPCWSLWGEEYANYTYKGFDPDLSYMTYAYSTTPGTPIIVSPQVEQTLIDPQVSFQVNPVGDVDGDPVSYRFIVSTGQGGTGTVIDSGFSASTQWTVPDGVLQDGNTYYVRAYSADPYGWSSPTSDVKFKVDMRRGNDKTQSVDTVGPVNVDLATGNVSTNISSHDTTALGGNLGVSLNYNSPMRSRNGLVGRYWNNSSQSGAVSLTRVDKNINFNWDQASYSSGQPLDYFSTIWDGYFVAPVRGDYIFGGSNDDGLTIKLGSERTEVYNQGCYSANPCYGSAYHMEQGQVVPIQVLFAEAIGSAYARLYVKGPVAEQIVPTEWLQTGVRPVQQNKGLQGRYYALNAGNNLDASDKNIFLSRVEPVMSFNWGDGSPIPNGQVDFMSRWEGYITTPLTATYRFKTLADDGTRLKINGVDLSPAGSWNKCCSETQFTDITLTAGVSYQIVADHYDGGGPGSYALYIETTDGSISKQIVPSSWLSPVKRVLPDGWQLGIDPDGELNYERLNATSSAAVLTDSSGDTHSYAATNSGGYKPSVNEDGQLTRNPNGTFTLIDTDGKTYTFKTDGQLDTVTLPTDDRKPAALNYSYLNGVISKIADGVDTSRNAQVYYYGDGFNKCTNAASSGFLDQTDASILGLLCAVITNDARATYFYYSNAGSDLSGNKTPVLGRVVSPGGEATDYQYIALLDGYTGRVIGTRIGNIRDSLGNDAVVASAVTGRVNDDTTKTQLSYDSIGRVNLIKAPAAKLGGTRQMQKIEYTPYAAQLNRYYGGNGDHLATTGSAPNGYVPENQSVDASLLLKAEANTQALYSCVIGSDQFVSTDSNCEGTQKLGLIGYTYIVQPPSIRTKQLYRCRLNSNGEHFVSQLVGCEGQVLENGLGYAISGTSIFGQTKQYVVTDAQPAPTQTDRTIEWDATFRTVRDTDVTGKASVQEWDTVKDLLRSATDATGLKSTTIYNSNDMPTDSYGPAPAAWFNDSGIPASNVEKIPHTSTTYDSGIYGAQITWFDFKSTNGGMLTGAPRLHTTGFPNGFSSDVFWMNTSGGMTAPVTKSTGADGYGFTATAKLVFSANETHKISVVHDDAARLYINDVLLVDRWSNRSGDSTITTDINYSFEASKFYRFRFDYANANNGVMAFKVILDGDTNTVASTRPWGDRMRPDYGLQTSQTVYGAPTSVGATTTLTSKTNYGSNPELGLAQSVSTDSTGLNLTSTSTYEAAGAVGSYLRQTSSSLPGGATTKYDYYAAVTDTDNPCTSTTTEHYHEGGMLRLKTEPDPDGTGPQIGRTVETVYDDTGKVVATRYNQDVWTCTTYDSRERVLMTTVPAYNGQAARTITNNYAVGGNPLVTSSSDSTGTITVETDLLGRNVKYTDAKGNVTTSTYDSKGHLAQRVSKLGTEDYIYDSVDRLTDQKLGGVVYAHVNYDTFSRITDVTYPTGLKLTLTREPDGTGTGGLYGLGRVIGRTYTTAAGQALSDNVTRAVTGDVISGTELGAAKSYGYDTAGRLVNATVAGNTFTYGYGTQATSCVGKPGIPTGTDLSLAGKDSNRTSQMVNGVSTTYCYDQADRLVASSDALYDTPEYDSHGNTTRLGSGATTTNFTYDSSDRNTSITETNASGSITTTYARDVQGRLLYRHQDTNGTNVSNDCYGYTASGDSPDFITDVSGTVTQKYLSLPGGVKVTIRPQSTGASAQTYSLPNVHGDVFATISADGVVLGTTQTGPFGELITGQINPWNTVNGGTLGYVGSAQKLTEAQLAVRAIQMGARVYIPGLGRFLQVDPVQGGTLNNYVYAADPVNEYDLSGTCIYCKILLKIVVREGGKKAAKSTVKQTVKPIVRQQVRISPSTVSSGSLRVTQPYQAKGIAGTYQFITPSNTTYSGMSTRDIGARLSSHVRRGIYEPGKQVTINPLQNASRIQIRSAEQKLINGQGGIGAPGVENQINSIAPKFWDNLGL